MRFHSVNSIWITLLATATIAFAAEPIESKGVYVHSFSHFSFPTNVGSFDRVALNKYDKEGRDISAGYNLRERPLSITVYVYPAPKNVAASPQNHSAGVTDALVRRHFEQVKNDIERRRSDAKVLSETTFELPQENNKRRGRRAVFTYLEPFAGLKQDVQSELYLFLLEPDTMFLIDDRFFVKIRATYPASERMSAEKEVQIFLKSLAWPKK